MPTPVFSIITVVYNGAALLPGTVESVRGQTYSNLEYLIVDGGSSDGTVDLIRQYAAEMPNLRWVSEKDRGLYDAMNKGQRLASGDFVWFMNCGDHVHEPNTVEKIANLIDGETDVVFGETLLVNEARQAVGTMSDLSTRSVPVRLQWRDYMRGMLVVHQSFIARRALAPEYIPDNLCADYDWCIRILKKSRKNVYAGGIISDYLMGGMSKQRHWQSLKDRFSVMHTHYGLARTLLAHGYIVLRAFSHRIRRMGDTRY